MHRKKLMSMVILGAAVASAGALQAASTYTISRIGLTGPKYLGQDPVFFPIFGTTIESNQIFYANTAGIVLGLTSQYDGTANQGSSAAWIYNGSSTIQLGLTDAAGLHVRPTSAGAAAGDVSTSLAGFSGNPLQYNNGYVAGFSSRWNSANTSLGADAWLFNGTTSTLIPVPTPASGPSNSTYPAGSIAYSRPNATGDIIQSMGGSGGANLVIADGNGTAAGAATVYYNSGTVGSPTWTAIGNGFSDYDAWYYNGVNSVQIGLISGLNVNSASTTGVSGTVTQPFDRASVPVKISTHKVFGYSKYYGGSTALTTANGQDLWIYDPSNPSGAGANGTQLIAPSVPAVEIGTNVYAGGNSSLGTPSVAAINNIGQIAAAFQKFAVTDTSRATALAQDAFIYTSSTNSYTQVGLTGAAYTFQVGTATPALAKSGYGGSNFATTGSGIFGYLTQYPALNDAGMAVGFTKRTGVTTGPVNLGQDAWIYTPSAGTTQVGLTGGVYETNTGTGVTRVSAPNTLSTVGGVSGLSQRYQTATGTATAGQDAWYYDPAHGITSSTQVGLTGANYEVLQTGATNNFRSSTITAMNQTGMVGGTSVRMPVASNTNAGGTDAWVFDSATNKTYNIDPNDTLAAGSKFTANLLYITDSGVAIGWDDPGFAGGSPATFNQKLFMWYLAFDVGTGLNDIPTWSYLNSDISPAALSGTVDNTPGAPTWASIYSSLGTSGPATTIGGIIPAYAALNSDNSTSTVAVLLIPTPEPASLALLAPAGLMLVKRRRRQA